ncbi:probable E3 ubiquitin-protein ligase RHY1A [Musa acuminata AAA Group]|uniref:probable E3 ubiquitin-protein ligase RHY1A n=1 Tax=Musa acuminata AAA Group TaxID=214697 RepID=UPI0031D326C1
MLSASGLLYSWRSRAGRSQSDPDPGTDPLSSSSSASTGDAHPRHPRRYRNRRRRFIGRDPSGGLIFGPQLEPRRPSHIHHQTEHEPVWVGNVNDGESASTGSSNAGSASSTLDRLRLTRNDQLPGVVLQARARLQERLRGVSLLESSTNEIAVGDELRLIDIGELDTENRREWLTAETDEDVRYFNKPPGLSSEAFCSLQLEVFQDREDVNDVARAFLECSICLEKFLEGDEMIRLSCGHRFHPACLEPWVKTCGDCPYCRTRI